MVTTVTRTMRGDDKVASMTDGKREMAEFANGNGINLSRSLSSGSTDTIVVIIEEGPTEMGMADDSKLACIVIGVPFIALVVVVLLVFMVMRENWEGY